MSSTLFNTFSVKGSLKFYKSANDDEKITIGISISANHQVDENIYENINEFLEKLLIEDYINEDVHNIRQDEIKLKKKQAKEQAKSLKELEKKALKARKTAKSGKPMKKEKSVY